MRRHRGKGNSIYKLSRQISVLFLAVLIGMGLLNVGYSLWFADLELVGTVTTGNWCEIEDQDGTIGFWKNWDSNNTYSQGQIEGWLGAIDSSPSWLGPTNVVDMVDALTMGQDHTMRDMFIAQYLATRLTVASSRLCPEAVRDFLFLDPGDYLGLGGQGTVGEIIDAIESKYDLSSPSDDNELEIMKNICDALNNNSI